MLILFIFIVIAVWLQPTGKADASAIFFSIGPMIYNIDAFVKNWWNLQKSEDFPENQDLDT